MKWARRGRHGARAREKGGNSLRMGLATTRTLKNIEEIGAKAAFRPGNAVLKIISARDIMRNKISLARQTIKIFHRDITYSVSCMWRERSSESHHHENESAAKYRISAEARWRGGVESSASSSCSCSHHVRNNGDTRHRASRKLYIGAALKQPI